MIRAKVLLAVTLVVYWGCSESPLSRSDGGCGCGDGELTGGGDSDRNADGGRKGADGRGSDGASIADVGVRGWAVAYEETFESLAVGAPSWRADTYPNDGPFSDFGRVFTDPAIDADLPKLEREDLPTAFRASWPFGRDGWLTAESYTRDEEREFGQLLRVVADPAGGANKVLQLSSPAHTDATVIRPSDKLPARYRVSLRVGYADFGTGSGNNGYDGGESARPWIAGDANSDNGFYWLAILDAPPRPHNNVWIHQHRKVVVDSDNHQPPWTEIYNGSDFVLTGIHPAMMIWLDGRSTGTMRTGKQFITYAAGAWQREAQIDAIRAVDAYKPNTWYRVLIERSEGHYTIEVSGDFAHGGQQTYRASLDYADNCVWHYNNTPEELAPRCVDESAWPGLEGFPKWPASGAWPDYFMFGDPHANFYEGKVYYDDVKLEIWKP
jgi:hypothetical protein